MGNAYPWQAGAAVKAWLENDTPERRTPFIPACLTGREFSYFWESNPALSASICDGAPR